jgi:peroxiredoxin/ribosomal protein L40E
MLPKICPKCIAANREEASFCRNCGKVLVALPWPHQKDAGRVYCNICGNANRSGARHCARCGKPLVQPRPVPPSVQPSPVQRLICQRCGIQNRESAKYCAQCGQELLRKPQTSKKRPIPIWPLAVVLIMICIGGFAFILLREHGIMGLPATKTATVTATYPPSPTEPTLTSTFWVTASPTDSILPDPTITSTPSPTSTIVPSPTTRPTGKPVQGEVAPNFSLIDARSGEVITLSDLTGQPVMINFWATWCGYCKDEMPAIQAEYEKYQDDGLVILGLDVGDSRSSVLSYADELGLTFNLLLDSDEKVSELYLVQGLPTSFFVRRDSVIEILQVGSLSEAELSQYIKRIVEN